MEYVSQKTVTILERRLGLMHLFFFVLIMGYMVGVRLVMEKDYKGQAGAETRGNSSQRQHKKKARAVGLHVRDTSDTSGTVAAIQQAFLNPKP